MTYTAGLHMLSRQPDSISNRQTTIWQDAAATGQAGGHGHGPFPCQAAASWIPAEMTTRQLSAARIGSFDEEQNNLITECMRRIGRVRHPVQASSPIKIPMAI